MEGGGWQPEGTERPLAPARVRGAPSVSVVRMIEYRNGRRSRDVARKRNEPVFWSPRMAARRIANTRRESVLLINNLQTAARCKEFARQNFAESSIAVAGDDVGDH
jgi:hypothetical protein